tara:strand:- start:186 stop:527 length:342 start_codon:yes stop_codon:yes gene_type:complete
MSTTIQHPTLEGYKLNLEGLLGPENAVFHRGRLISQSEIKLPNYWEKLVEQSSISVHLTPIGAHQHVIVKRVGDNKVYLQSQGNMPIDCYYLIMGERIDIEDLVAEEQVDSDG